MTALAAIGVWVACGSEEEQPVEEAADSGADTATVDSAKPETSAPDTSTPAPDAAYEAGPVYDAGAPVTLDGGPGFDGGPAYEGGIPCVVGGQIEEEPNDTLGQANVLNPTRCGVVIAQDGGPEDVDWLRFTLADASTNFYVQYAGDVKVKVETDGMAPVDISAPDASLIYRQGQPYFVKVNSSNGKTQTWRVTLFQK